MTALTHLPRWVFKVNFEDDPLAAYGEYIQSLGPLGYWRLNESAGTNANDGSPNNRDGTYTGGFTLSQAGALVPYGDSDTAVSFNGSTGYVDFVASSTWRNLSAAWTLGAWIYPTATREADSSDMAGILCVDYPAADPVPWFLNYGRLEAGAGVLGSNVWGGFHTVGGWGVVQDPIEPTLNTYTHYIVTWNGSLLSIYRNFVFVDSAVPGIANASAGADRKMYIGRQTHTSAGSGTDAFFPGRIDEPFILDWAMQPADIAKLEGSLSSPADKSTNYIDLSTRVRAFSLRRGRQDSVNRVEAGDLSIVLDNRDGVLLPDPIVNLLPNPSFEADQPFLPFTVSGGTRTRDTTHVQSGTYAMMLTGSTAAGTCYASSAQGGLTAMRPGEQYTFSAYVYVPSGTGVDLADVSLEIVDEVSGSPQTTSSGNPGSFNTFVRLSVTRTIRTNADASYCRVVFAVDVAGDDIWVDAVQLEEGSSATTYCDGDQTDCRWNGEPHLSLSHRKVAGSYRNIMPGRLFTLDAVWNSTTYPLMKGQVEEWAYTFPGLDADSVAVLRCIDGFGALSRQTLTGYRRPAESVGARVRAILRSSGVPESEIDVDDTYISASTLAALTVSGDTSARQLIAEVEETEKGLFFIAASGKHTYQGSLFRSVGKVEAFKLKDDDTEITYSEIAAQLNLANISNVTTITNEANATDHSFIQPASVRRFFPLTLAESSEFALDIVSYVDRSQPFPYTDAVEVKPYREPAALWPQMLGMEISDLGKIERVVQGQDLFRGFLQHLEGFSIEADGSSWVYRLNTTPVLQAPVPITEWTSPISIPTMLTSYPFDATDANTYTFPSAVYVAGRLYVLFYWTAEIGGPAPVPTFTSANTWNTIRTDTSGIRSWGMHYTVAAGATEALAVNFAGGSDQFEGVIFEIASGFNATPIGVNNYVSSAASTLSLDVGTLTNAQSIVLAAGWKSAAPGPSSTWPVFTKIYGRDGDEAYTVAFGPPGIDTSVVQWVGDGAGEGGAMQNCEVKSV